MNTIQRKIDTRNKENIVVDAKNFIQQMETLYGGNDTQSLYHFLISISYDHYRDFFRCIEHNRFSLACFKIFSEYEHYTSQDVNFSEGTKKLILDCYARELQAIDKKYKNYERYGDFWIHQIISIVRIEKENKNGTV